MTTGEKIRQLRKEMGMTQEELGNMIGVKKAAINKYETGIVVNLKQSTIAALAKALNVSPIDLLSPDGLDQHRRQPVIVPNSEEFVKIAGAMSPDDYMTVMNIFEKTYNKLKEKGEI